MSCNRCSGTGVIETRTGAKMYCMCSLGRSLFDEGKDLNEVLSELKREERLKLALRYGDG